MRRVLKCLQGLDPVEAQHCECVYMCACAYVCLCLCVCVSVCVCCVYVYAFLRYFSFHKSSKNEVADADAY